MSLEAYCDSAVGIPWCVEYNGLNSCLYCQDGYYVKNSFCEEIAQENCLQLDPLGKCTKCKSTHFLDKQSQCVLLLQSQQTYCLTEINSKTHFQKFQCAQCKTNSYYKTLQVQPLCILKSNLPSITSDCVEYVLDNQQFRCTKCGSDLILDQSSSLCVLTCANTLYPLQFQLVSLSQTSTQITNIKYSQCVSETSTCATKGYNAKGELNCLKCKNGSIKVT